MLKINYNYQKNYNKKNLNTAQKTSSKLKFFVLKGKVINRKNSFAGTSGVVSFGKNTKNKIEKMFKGGLEHHVAFTYGDYYNEIVNLGNQMKIPTYTV